MKITGKILNNINENIQMDDNASNILSIYEKGIKFLIDDEKEAYQGYNQFLADISEKISEELYEETRKVISHIIEEEQEHIRELETLYNKISSKIN